MIRAEQLVAGAALVCLFAGCRPQGLTSQQSAARVARAIEVLRNAPNEAKAVPLAALAELGCTGPDVCETRDACVSGYTLHVDAGTLTQRAKAQLSDGQPPEAAKLLFTAQQKLTEASRKVADCVEREGALRHRYKL